MRRRQASWSPHHPSPSRPTISAPSAIHSDSVAIRTPISTGSSGRSVPTSRFGRYPGGCRERAGIGNEACCPRSGRSITVGGGRGRRSSFSRTDHTATCGTGPPRWVGGTESDRACSLHEAPVTVVRTTQRPLEPGCSASSSRKPFRFRIVVYDLPPTGVSSYWTAPTVGERARTLRIEGSKSPDEPYVGSKRPTTHFARFIPATGRESRV